MAIGYILAVVFAVIWFAISIYENHKKESAKRQTAKNAAEQNKECDTDIDDLIL